MHYVLNAHHVAKVQSDELAECRHASSGQERSGARPSVVCVVSMLLHTCQQYSLHLVHCKRVHHPRSLENDQAHDPPICLTRTERSSSCLCKATRHWCLYTASHSPSYVVQDTNHKIRDKKLPGLHECHHVSVKIICMRLTLMSHDFSIQEHFVDFADDGIQFLQPRPLQFEICQIIVIPAAMLPMVYAVSVSSGMG